MIFIVIDFILNLFILYFVLLKLLMLLYRFEFCSLFKIEFFLICFDVLEEIYVILEEVIYLEKLICKKFLCM